MHKQTKYDNLLKAKVINTRLQMDPVFKIYKPNNEKAKMSVFYRGATSWNKTSANDRNLPFDDFKTRQKNVPRECLLN